MKTHLTIGLLIAAAMPVPDSRAQTYTILYDFTGPSGAYPYGGVTRDTADNLYGTTYHGGRADAGVVFKLDNSGHPTVLYSFTGGTDGFRPFGGLIRDEAGNLYGTTLLGGTLNQA